VHNTITHSHHHCCHVGEDVYTETGKKPGKNGNGLVAGHAYSLIAVRETSKGDKLVKLRSACMS